MSITTIPREAADPNSPKAVDSEAANSHEVNPIDETTGLPVKAPFMYHDGPDPLHDPAEGADRPRVETYDPETGEYEPSQKFNPDGIEGVDWEWETELGITPEDVNDVLTAEPFDFTALHSCVPSLPHSGYKQATAYCQEDIQGRLWLVDPHGRNQTQALFCPFCGFQALDSTAPAKPMQIVPQDIALTPADRPQRVWVQNHARVMMRHFQFGSVRVLASDGCHAKCLTEAMMQVTVCVENLEEIKGERCLPKFASDKPVRVKKERGAIDPETMARYMNMGL